MSDLKETMRQSRELAEDSKKQAELNRRKTNIMCWTLFGLILASIPVSAYLTGLVIGS